MGGKVEVLSLPLHFDFNQLRLTPHETRSLFQRLGWQRIVCFQTRNPIQRPQFEMTMRAMRAAKANILIHPVVGMTKPGDFDHFTRMRCYKAIAGHYPPNSYLLNLLPLAMRMAGPREALMHAIISKNYGCTHFIVGRSHASPGANGNGGQFYESDEARKRVEEFSSEISIQIVPFEELVYLPFRRRIPVREPGARRNPNHILVRFRHPQTHPNRQKNTGLGHLSGSHGRTSRRPIHPPGSRGSRCSMTGLSGSGKSTIAKVLYARFQEIGERPVTLLDGDIVRRNLSSGLSFSKEDRDTNVRRISFVASEITKNRGVAICAPIAPYAATRQEIRKIIEEYGGFVEVHVATPLEECEKRDRKGMYAKARAGLDQGIHRYRRPL